MTHARQLKYAFSKIAIIGIAILFSLLWIAGCNDDDEPAVPVTPTITAISPESGPVGTQVIITGTNFSTTASENTVTFNDVAANVTSATALRIETIVPANATTGPVKVTVNGNTVTGPEFTVTEPTPEELTITSIAPMSGAVGTEVTITGTNFGATAEENTVTFTDDVPAEVTSVSDTSLVVLVPDGAVTGPITVTVGDQSKTSADFEVTTESGLTISSIDPVSGAVEDTVTIIGTGFSTTLEDNTVIFTDGIAATVAKASDTSLVVTVPENAATGPITVTVGENTVTSDADFTVTTTASELTLDPVSGPAGTEVTITGATFSVTAEDNTVTFTDGVSATVTSASESELKVTVPDGAVTGPVTVTVGEETYSSDPFTVTTAGGLAITLIDPTEGAVGTEVTITGLGFGTTAVENIVVFSSAAEGGDTVEVNSAGATELKVSVPENAVTGPISVTVGGETVSSSAFTVTGEGGGTTYVVSHIAGSSSNGSAIDGSAKTARFNEPFGLAIDAAGNIYIGERLNHRVRKLTADLSEVSTFAGSDAGYENGTGAAAKFNEPTGLAFDADGILYVSEAVNRRVRKITPAGEVTLLAGSGAKGVVDGQGDQAQFSIPFAIFINANDEIFVADFDGHTIRKITKEGNVTIYTGVANSPGDANGALNVAQFRNPYYMAEDGDGNLYISDFGNHRIRKISPDGEVTTLAGGTQGYADGQGDDARFDGPSGLAVDAVGNVYVADRGNHVIRKITPEGVVTTVAGAAGETGGTNGNGPDARFNEPNGLVMDADGNLYVSERLRGNIRKIIIQ